MRAIAMLTACCAAAAGCGGHAADRPLRPLLPAHVARAIAGQSRAVASWVDHGRACEARSRFAELQAYVEGVVTAGAVPPPLRRSLRDGVVRLGRLLPPCVRTAAVPRSALHSGSPDENRGGGSARGHRGKGKGHGEGHGKGKEHG